MRNSVMLAAPAGFGQVLPSVILEFFGSVNATIGSFLLIDARFGFDIGDVVGHRERVHRPVVYPPLALLVHPGQGVLHPVLAVAVGIILAGRGAATTRTG